MSRDHRDNTGDGSVAAWPLQVLLAGYLLCVWTWTTHDAFDERELVDWRPQSIWSRKWAWSDDVMRQCPLLSRLVLLCSYYCGVTKPNSSLQCVSLSGFMFHCMCLCMCMFVFAQTCEVSAPSVCLSVRLLVSLLMCLSTIVTLWSFLDLVTHSMMHSL